MTKLSTRGPVTAQAIAAKKDFTTHGALRGENVKSLSNWDSGQLSGDDLTQFRRECSRIEYVVFSYSTPIAWYLSDKGWYKVAQKFSVTTSKHQGNLYLI